ncbi:hypothetical protein C2W64_04277 [Brevibacillus laterosporus]|nr:hypothetical protein C2W64_04277 [Brevibacillus laterosporus]
MVPVTIREYADVFVKSRAVTGNQLYLKVLIFVWKRYNKLVEVDIKKGLH